MKIAIVTDAWFPQNNGVVKTLSSTVESLQALGHEMLVIEPGQFRTLPCPTYPEIRLAWFPYQRMDGLLSAFVPDALHIATEGALGAAARSWCLRNRMKFTTSYHTQFPEYLRARAPLPLSWSYAYLRRFHAAAMCTMVATATLQRQLEARGFRNIVRWTRGVDTRQFQIGDRNYLNYPRPIAIYVGRIAVEKNIEAFLEFEWPGTKVVVGDGPQRKELEARFGAARFVGYQHGAALARYVAAADVFVFPSRTDTFGLVLLEAMACGVPVAAYPVAGPIDVVRQGVTGVLDEDLRKAALAALHLDPRRCRAHALDSTWEAATQQFLSHTVPASRNAARLTAEVHGSPPRRLRSARPLGSVRRWFAEFGAKQQHQVTPRRVS